jgi:RimJ/RimL family protein N-acetyltransferase
VSYYEELDGPREVFVKLVAVSKDLRRQGGGYADEMFAQTLDAITARALDYKVEVTEVLISGLIEPANRPSQAMAKRAGFQHRGILDNLQLWERNLPVGTPGDIR